MTARTRLVVSILAAALVTGAVPVRAAAGDPAKGQARAFLCAACHGMNGKSQVPDIPHLAGQHETYLAAQMKSFRTSTAGTASRERRRARHDVVMSQQAVRLSGADMENLAAYYAAQPCRRRGAAVGGSMPTAARRCISCHGDGGRSVSPAVPRLAGQQERYLELQLRAFRDSRGGETGMRRDRQHPLMGRQTKRLGDEEILALARYFAGQPCR